MHEFDGIGVEKFRVGAQIMRELGKAAFEADAGDDLVHLGADAFDFGNPDGVNLLGGQLGGGVIADQRTVVLASVGGCGNADAVAAGGKVDVGKHSIEARESRQHHFVDRAPGLVRQAFAVGCRNVARHPQQRSEERARLGRCPPSCAAICGLTRSMMTRG